MHFKKLIVIGLCLVALSTPVEAAIVLDFQQIPIERLLEIMAKRSGESLILPKPIKRTINVQIKTQNWDEAWQTVLKAAHLKAKKIQGGWLVEEAAQSDAPMQASHNYFLRLNYADAKTILAILTNKSIMPNDVLMTADERTNGLIVHASAREYSSILAMIQHLDVPIEQVMIMSKIVSIDREKESELGVRFGVSGDHLTGSLSNARGALNQKLWLDLPAVNPEAAHVGLALMKISPALHLDMELSALESSGEAEVISSPRVMTANRQAASIEAGQDIPYQEKAGEGATSVAFKKAVLSLNVTPDIIPQGKILLHLRVSEDKRSAKEVQGVPAIDMRRIQTQVLVNDGQTIVLGGIYEHVHNETQRRVPFLSAMPVLGRLFQYRRNEDSAQELLIFVTPKIVRKAL